ncbi:hypothetical protein KIL84_009655 [Mauremys mutica]|uniref:RING-type E3 ubiquitin transferase n=1 Tax=Mauremys mutica TaxID=74926 RepID=A0A9D3XLA2_9SAUR|nr:hypothetical protein KIL84_009655 [Mauremys mutica]
MYGAPVVSRERGRGRARAPPRGGEARGENAGEGAPVPGAWRGALRTGPGGGEGPARRARRGPVGGGVALLRRGPPGEGRGAGRRSGRFSPCRPFSSHPRPPLAPRPAACPRAGPEPGWSERPSDSNGGGDRAAVTSTPLARGARREDTTRRRGEGGGREEQRERQHLPRMRGGALLPVLPSPMAWGGGGAAGPVIPRLCREGGSTWALPTLGHGQRAGLLALHCNPPPTGTSEGSKPLPPLTVTWGNQYRKVGLNILGYFCSGSAAVCWDMEDSFPPEEIGSGQRHFRLSKTSMRSEEKRLRTFRQWPESSPVSATDLAKAGFFFLGPGDRVQCFCCGGQGDTVRCFYCDGSLRNWELGDDPWREHAKWFPRCEFLLQSRGRDFVSSVQDSDFNTLVAPGGSWQRAEQDPPVPQDSVGNRELSSPPLDQSSVVQNVLQMGFDHSLVMSLVQSRHLLTGTCYLSVSELVLDLLQVDGEESSSAEERERTERETGMPGQRRDAQAECSKESAESPLSTEEKLRRLQEERMCKVCMDKDVSIVFVPCGHLVVCAECAPSLRRCPICRAVIRGSVRTFMS